MPVTAIEKSSVGAAVVSVFATLVVLAAPRPQFHGADGQPLTYFLAEGNPTSGYQPSDRELALWAIETWARASDGALQLQASAERDAVVRLYWAPAKDGQLGEMRPLRVKGRPGAAVYVRPDLDALGPKIAGRAQQDSLWRDAIVYLACLHELGHALGLAHTSDERDIMYFFGYGGSLADYFARYREQLTTRPDIQTVSALSASDAERLRKLLRHDESR